MDNAGNDLNDSQICRVCLQAEDPELDRALIDIFSEERGFSIVDSLHQICSIQVSTNDHFPQLICSVCIPRLRNAFFLRLLSLRSQQTLSSSRRHQVTPPKELPAVPPFEYIEFSEMRSDVKPEDEDPVTCEESAAVFRCCGCDDEGEFESEMALKRHSIQAHCPKKLDVMMSGKVRCSVCWVVFQEEAEVMEHREKFPHVRTLRGCSYCRCNFFSEDTLEVHIGQFHKDRQYRCCGCEFRSDSQIELATHTLFHKHAAREEGPPGEGGFQCAVCYARFETLRKRQHHERLPYQKDDTTPVATNQPRKLPGPPERKRQRIDASKTCDKCSVKFPDNKALESHQCIVVHECPYCPKKFINKKTLETHKCEVSVARKKSPRKPQPSSAPGREQHQCSLCYEFFKNPSSLRNHMVTHAPNQSYPCRYCSATFMRETGRDNHEVRHTGQATYRCEVCGKPNNKRQSYVQHYETTHATAAEQIHACTMCEQRFTFWHFLANHLYFVHRVRSADDGTWKKKFIQQEVTGEEDSAGDV
uniref:PR domain zinc finger protein 5 n=2 Tax=Culex pipiens TaxID=7175 RepID=A0A8D8A0C1_CULPI